MTLTLEPHASKHKPSFSNHNLPVMSEIQALMQLYITATPCAFNNQHRPYHPCQYHRYEKEHVTIKETIFFFFGCGEEGGGVYRKSLVQFSLIH